jgi:hypothetical protein
MNFPARCNLKELLDDPDIPDEDLKRNLVELDLINRYLGGHKITIEAIRRLFKTSGAKEFSPARPLHICEIGCGGGDNLQVIDRWAKRRGIPLLITGVDMKETCTRFAENKQWHHPTRWITDDYRNAAFDTPPDILFSSLFCHHFPDSELPGMLSWMYDRSTLGFFINDLHRHPLAYYSIKWITGIFSRSYLVRNDAPLSVRRGFVKPDWQKFIDQSGLPGASIRWKWAFRWLVLVSH